jgi:hypothetical protein
MTKISEMASKVRDIQRDAIDIQMQQQYVPGLGYVGPSGVTPGQKPGGITEFDIPNPVSVGLPTGIETSPNMLGYDPNKLPDAVSEDSKIVDTHTNIIQENSDETKTATEKLREMKEAAKSNSKAMADGAQIVGASVQYCSDTLNSVQSLLNAANGGSGGGGGSCRSFGSSERVQAGSDIVYEGPERGNAYVSNTISQGGVSYDVVRNSAGGSIVGYVNTATGAVSERVNDALITKTGKVVEFNKDDNILAFKDGNLKGNKTINMTFNIYESKDSKELMREIMKEINRVVRVG